MALLGYYEGLLHFPSTTAKGLGEGVGFTFRLMVEG